MNVLNFKRMLGHLWGFQRAEDRDVILIYHSVAGGALSTPEVRFREQMDWLRDNAQVMTLDTLLNTPNNGELRVALSFDDGYRTLYDTAYPALAERGFPAIVYLNSGLLGEGQHFPSTPELGHYPGEYFLTWGEVAHLCAHGWAVGGHGVDHLDLTRASATEIRRQLVDCKAQIEDRLNTTCHHFSYTWGRYSPLVRAAVMAAGFRSAVSGLHGRVMSSSDRYALPRIDIRPEYELCDFVDVVTGRWDYLGIKQRLARRLA